MLLVSFSYLCRVDGNDLNIFTSNKRFVFLLVRESEDTALLLLKEIYDNLGVAIEQPQQ